MLDAIIEDLYRERDALSAQIDAMEERYGEIVDRISDLKRAQILIDAGQDSIAIQTGVKL